MGAEIHKVTTARVTKRLNLLARPSALASQAIKEHAAPQAIADQVEQIADQAVHAIGSSAATPGVVPPPHPVVVGGAGVRAVVRVGGVQAG